MGPPTPGGTSSTGFRRFRTVSRNSTTVRKIASDDGYSKIHRGSFSTHAFDPKG